MESKELETNKEFASIPLNLLSNDSDDVDKETEKSPDSPRVDKSLKKKSNSLKRFFSQKKINTVVAEEEIDANQPSDDSKRTTLSKRFGHRFASLTNQKMKSKGELETDASGSHVGMGPTNSVSMTSNRFRFQGYFANYWNSVFGKPSTHTVTNTTQNEPESVLNEDLMNDATDPIHTNPIAAIEEN